MEMEVEDEIETEIDIVYSGELDSEMNLFQYPLIPKESLTSSLINSISINRPYTLMKIEKNLDKRTLNQFAQKLNPAQTLIGERIEANTNLLVGVIRENVFYLTPVSNIYQFRHDFSKSDGVSEVVNAKKKVERRDYRSTMSALVKNEKENIVYSPLTLFRWNSIESCSMIERMCSIASRYPFKKGQIEFLPKESYYALLLKYINDKSVIDELNEKAIPSDHSIEDTIFRRGKKSKDAFGLAMIKPRANAKAVDIDKMDIDEDKAEANLKSHQKKLGGSVILSTIQQLFGKSDCLSYDKLINDIAERLRIDKRDQGQMNKLDTEISEICFVHNNKTCFLKLKGEDEETNAIRLKLLEFLSQHNDTGVKRAKVTSCLKENNISFRANVVTAVLNSIGKKGKNDVWSLKEAF